MDTNLPFLLIRNQWYSALILFRLIKLRLIKFRDRELNFLGTVLKSHPGDGEHNITADTLSIGSAIGSHVLIKLHNSLCHPSIMKMLHFVRTSNLAFSVENVKVFQPLFTFVLSAKPVSSTWCIIFNQGNCSIWARLGVDFKDLLPSLSINRYLL